MNGASEICGRQILKILLGPFLNTLTHISWKDLSLLLNEMLPGSI